MHTHCIFVLFVVVDAEIVRCFCSRCRLNGGSATDILRATQSKSEGTSIILRPGAEWFLHATQFKYLTRLDLESQVCKFSDDFTEVSLLSTNSRGLVFRALYCGRETTIFWPLKCKKQKTAAMCEEHPWNAFFDVIEANGDICCFERLGVKSLERILDESVPSEALRHAWITQLLPTLYQHWTACSDEEHWIISVRFARASWFSLANFVL